MRGMHSSGDLLAIAGILIENSSSFCYGVNDFVFVDGKFSSQTLEKKNNSSETSYLLGKK